MNHVNYKLEFYNEAPDDMFERACQLLFRAMSALGFLDGGFMSGIEKEKQKHLEEQKQDLNYQKPEETDNIQKSAHPDADYMKDRNLDPETHGRKKDE
jgi:hypothetical protein